MSGRDQQLATRHTEDAADQTDAYANDEAHRDVNGGGAGTTAA